MERSCIYTVLCSATFLLMGCQDINLKGGHLNTPEETAAAGTQPEEAAAPVETKSALAENLFATEPVTVEKSGPKGTNVHFKFTMDFPVSGPENLVAQVKNITFNAIGEKSPKDTSVKGLEQAGEDFVKESVAEIKRLGEEHMAYGFEGTVDLTDNAPNYLTYHVNSYLYTGGAHGMPQNFYVTVSKLDGKPMGLYDIFNKEKAKALAEVIKEAVVEQYYKGKAPGWDDFFQFGLPTQAPALTAKGVRVDYQAYEIDCYAAGMPHCVLPYSKVAHLMTPRAQAMVE